MVKWFSISGIMTEVKRVRWPKQKELFKDTTTVVAVVTMFGIFFVLAQVLITFFVTAIGV
jgi:preprotein translocase subunit SecE